MLYFTELEGKKTVAVGSMEIDNFFFVHCFLYKYKPFYASFSNYKSEFLSE